MNLRISEITGSRHDRRDGACLVSLRRGFAVRSRRQLSCHPPSWAPAPVPDPDAPDEQPRQPRRQRRRIAPRRLLAENAIDLAFAYIGADPARMSRAKTQTLQQIASVYGSGARVSRPEAPQPLETGDLPQLRMLRITRDPYPLPAGHRLYVQSRAAPGGPFAPGSSPGGCAVPTGPAAAQGLSWGMPTGGMRPRCGSDGGGAVPSPAALPAIGSRPGPATVEPHRPGRARTPSTLTLAYAGITDPARAYRAKNSGAGRDPRHVRGWRPGSGAVSMRARRDAGVWRTGPPRRPPCPRLPCPIVTRSQVLWREISARASISRAAQGPTTTPFDPPPGRASRPYGAATPPLDPCRPSRSLSHALRGIRPKAWGRRPLLCRSARTAWARTGTKPARQEAIKARAAWPVGQDLPNGAPIAA